MFGGSYLYSSNPFAYVSYSVYIYTIAEFTNSTLVATTESNTTYPLIPASFPSSKFDELQTFIAATYVTGAFTSQTLVGIDISYTADTVDNESFISFNLEDVVGSFYL